MKKMLRYLGIISIVVFASRSLVSADEGVKNGSNSIQLQCRQSTGTVDLWAREGKCTCQKTPTSESVIGFEHLEGIGSYRFYGEAKKWNEARKMCITEGAHLAIIDSEAEAKALQGLLMKKKNTIKGANVDNEAWLGAHDQFNEGDWVTVLGEPVGSNGYAGWNKANEGGRPQQPDNYKNNENCAVLLDFTGTLHDIPCDWSMAFICERPNTCL